MDRRYGGDLSQRATPKTVPILLRKLKKQYGKGASEHRPEKAPTVMPVDGSSHSCPIVKSLFRYAICSQSAHIAQLDNGIAFPHLAACEDQARPTCNEATRRFRSSRDSLGLKTIYPFGWCLAWIAA
jgi:hypothetical protein